MSRNLDGRDSLAGLDNWITRSDIDSPSAEQPGPYVPTGAGWYRGFNITFNPKPVPASVGADWDYIHPDYDGPEDGRYGCCSSPEECAREIDEYYDAIEDENEQLRFETERRP